MPTRTPKRTIALNQEQHRYLVALLEYDLEHTELDDVEADIVAGMIRRLAATRNRLLLTPRIASYLKELLEDDIAQTELSKTETKSAKIILNNVRSAIGAYEKFGEMTYGPERG